MSAKLFSECCGSPIFYELQDETDITSGVPTCEICGMQPAKETENNYRAEIAPVTALVHRNLANWLECDVALISDNFLEARFYVPKFSAAVIYRHGMEVYKVMPASDNGNAIINLVTVTIPAFMVMELFTRRRIKAAMEAIK